jgi:hypothetical protein
MWVILSDRVGNDTTPLTESELMNYAAETGLRLRRSGNEIHDLDVGDGDGDHLAAVLVIPGAETCTAEFWAAHAAQRRV